MAIDSWMFWLPNRIAGMIIRPGGEQTYAASHDATYEQAKVALWPVVMKEYRDKGMDVEQADLEAQKFLDKFTPDRYHALNMELVKRHFVIIDDSSKAKGSFGGTAVFGMDKQDILRNEDAISSFVSKGPVVLIYEGAGDGVVLENVDIEESVSFDEAIEHAKKRKKSPIEEPATTDTASFDLGIWSLAARGRISFFR